MKETGPLFEEPWPDAETRLVIDAVRSAATRPGGATQNPLAEAGRRWAQAHQSASLMRARLSNLEASMEVELRTASESDRMAYYRAWRTVTDAATWTSLTQLEEAALLDPLTGVGNRRALDLMLTRATSAAQRAGSELAVVAVDLDGLKRINDSQGHAEGDRTLTSLVDAFGERLRGSDTVFRTGGDEFAVVLPGMRLGDVEPLMHRISAGGAPGFTWGAAAFDIEHQHPADLLDAADTDLYRRRGVEREAVGAEAVAGGPGEGAGGTIVGLRHPNGSSRTRVPRRTSLAVAAGLVAIAGTLGAVTPLSPANHAALPPKHPSSPSGRPGEPVVTPAVAAPPAPNPTASPGAPTTTPVTRGANTANIQLADVSTPSPSGVAVGAAANPAGGPAAGAVPPTTVPVTSAPPTTAPVSTVRSHGNPNKTLPPQAAAQAEHRPSATDAAPAATVAAPAAVGPGAPVARAAEVEAQAVVGPRDHVADHAPATAVVAPASADHSRRSRR